MNWSKERRVWLGVATNSNDELGECQNIGNGVMIGGPVRQPSNPRKTSGLAIKVEMNVVKVGAVLEASFEFRIVEDDV